MTMTTLRLQFAGATAGLQHKPLLAVVAAWVRPAWLAWDPCLPYLTGGIILALGLGMFLKKEALQKRGLDRIVALGPLCLAVPLAAFGGEHLMEGKAMADMVPAWIPGHLFWIYFVGVCLLLAALSLVLDRYAALAAALFGIMLLLFEGLLHIPLALSAPGNRFFWAVVFREMIFSSGALALAATYTEAWRKRGRHPIITIARFVIGVGILFFGVEQLLHPEFVPAVPLNRLTPAWIPAHSLWGYPVGVVFVIAGLCLTLDKGTRRAATWLGITILLVVVLVYVPINIESAADIGKGLNYMADTLLLGGAVLAFAGSQREKVTAQAGTSAAERVRPLVA